MIWFYIITFFGSFLNTMLSWLPKITELPFGMDSIAVQAIGSFRAFAEIFPPLQTVLSAFVIYFLFRGTLLTLRLFRIIR